MKDGFTAIEVFINNADNNSNDSLGVLPEALLAGYRHLKIVQHVNQTDF